MTRGASLFPLLALSALLGFPALLAPTGSTAAPADTPAHGHRPAPGNVRPPTTNAHGLSVAPDGTLQLDGRPFRGWGVNYYDLFVRTLTPDGAPPQSNRNFTSFHAGLNELARRRIPFARFAACGYWPVELRFYQTNRAEYLRRLQLVMRSAEAHKVGLIPSLFWFHGAVPDLVGEPVSRWGDPASRTRAFLEQYTTDVVSALHGSASVWAWEFGNEFNLPADLPNAADHRPPIVPHLGTPATRSAADDLSHAAMRSALAAFAQTVRRLDPHRLILSGHAFPRPSAWHQMTERSWRRDSPAQFEQMLAEDNPPPVDSYTVRGYEPSDWDRLPAAMAAARRARRPLFVGEFGVKGRATAEQRAAFQLQLDQLARLEVPLAALWVYDFPGQAADWNVSPTNDRAYQLDALAQANARLNASPRPRPADHAPQKGLVE